MRRSSLPTRAQIVARFAGGPNAGHTIAAGDRTIVLHSVPSGALREGVDGPPVEIAAYAGTSE